MPADPAHASPAPFHMRAAQIEAMQVVGSTDDNVPQVLSWILSVGGRAVDCVERVTMEHGIIVETPTGNRKALPEQWVIHHGHGRFDVLGWSEFEGLYTSAAPAAAGLLAAPAAQPDAPYVTSGDRLAAKRLGAAPCSTPCDDDCDADCHEVHAVPSKRGHEIGQHNAVASPAAPADDEAAPTMRTLHVTTTRDIPEGHTDQRVRYEYNGDSWEGWLIAAGSDAGEEIYIMRDNGERWVVMSDNVTLLDSTAALAALREGQ